MDGARTDPGPVQRGVENVFQLVARWRHGRALHTAGIVVDARLVLDPSSWTGAALGGPAERPAVVRLSKSVSLPGGRADLLGVGLRVATGDGGVDRVSGVSGVFDVLLASVGRHDLDHVVLLPSAGWWSRPYSTILPYRVNGRLLVLGLSPPPVAADADPAAVATTVARGPLELAVTEQPPGGRRRRIGTLTLEAVRPHAATAFSFDPVLNHPPGLRPARTLSRLRELAYTGSRRGRRADPAALDRTP
jgi:hypothetical protein